LLREQQPQPQGSQQYNRRTVSIFYGYAGGAHPQHQSTAGQNSQPHQPLLDYLLAVIPPFISCHLCLSHFFIASYYIYRMIYFAANQKKKKGGKKNPSASF
jgi:hypothetical protein